MDEEQINYELLAALVAQVVAQQRELGAAAFLHDWPEGAKALKVMGAFSSAIAIAFAPAGLAGGRQGTRGNGPHSLLGFTQPMSGFSSAIAIAFIPAPLAGGRQGTQGTHRTRPNN